MIGRRRALRVLVSGDLLHGHHPTSGHGRLWRAGLAELSRLTRVVEDGRRGDVWLTDVFAAPPPPGLPAAGYLAEAPWADPELVAGISDAFVAMGREATARGVARVDRVIAPARSSAAQITRALGVPADRIAVVPLGVDAAVFGAGDAARGRAAAGTEPYVLFAGQVHARKNLGALREAMEVLAAEGTIATLVVLASPAVDRPDSAALVAAATAPLRHGRLVALPRPGDPGLADLMAGAAVVCVPSLWEGFGLVAAEALAAGAPTVVSDRGSLPEVVGDAGVVVAPDPEALAAGIREALAAADRLRPAARARAAELSWAATARGWFDVLQDVASAR